MSLAPHSTKIVAHGCVDMMKNHDADALGSFFAENYIDHNFSVDNGREVHKAFWQTWFEALPDSEAILVSNALLDGDRVAGRFTHRATFQGSFMGREPTGRHVQVHSIDIWRVTAGMAVEHGDVVSAGAFFTPSDSKIAQP